MPKGRVPKTNGATFRTKYSGLACGKLYSGPVRKVEKLILMHQKVCKRCKNAEAVTAHVTTVGSLDTSSEMKKIMNDPKYKIMKH